MYVPKEFEKKMLVQMWQKVFQLFFKFCWCFFINKKRYIVNSMKEHKKSGDPLFFQIENKMTTQVKTIVGFFIFKKTSSLVLTF